MHKAYRINRLDHTGDGHHYRSRRSVEYHLSNAPHPSQAKKPKRYPHRYHNYDNHYAASGSLYEYPTMDFPYENQNAKGWGKRTRADGTVETVRPRYTRTITDRNKQIQGVSYHPFGDSSNLVRAEEVRSSRRRR